MQGDAFERHSVVLPMPPSVPDGMRLELNRARLLPGAEEETQRWMDMLHDRYSECIATLDAERMAFEATFRHTDSDGTEWLYHLSFYGEGGAGLDVSNAVDEAHQEYAYRCKEPGWEELHPVLMLAPEPVRAAMEAWGRTGSDAELRPLGTDSAEPTDIGRYPGVGQPLDSPRSGWLDGATLEHRGAR